MLFFSLHRITLIASLIFLLNGEFTLSFYTRQNAIVQFQWQRNDDVLRSNTSLDLYTGIVDRRGSFVLSIPFCFIAPIISSAATIREQEKKPFAPLESLLPAIRLKKSIDLAVGLTKSLVEESSTGKLNTETLERLEAILLNPQNYVQTLKLQDVPSKPADLYLKSYKPMSGDLPLQRYLVQNGDVDTWKRLKRSEKAMEYTSEIRAALNAYTDALSFSADSYLLNVDKATRSNMVREDRLPDVKQVITSDMGMRYLYRNQVLTSMDDAKAELQYQLLHLEKDRFDGNELVVLLGLAGEAMDRWLSLVPPDDVKDAVIMLSV
ncbi:MAG: hypothetical protein ACI8RD_004137 [Bacillariaceae sp.]|jgi:hypothetical protein